MVRNGSPESRDGHAIDAPAPDVSVTSGEAGVKAGDTLQTYSGREMAIHTIVLQYEHHPRVVQAINQHMAERGTGVVAGVGDDRYFSYMGQFPLLDATEERGLFGYIEGGLSVYAGLPGPDLVLPSQSSEQEEALIRLVIARQWLFLSNLRLVVSIANQFAWVQDRLTLMDLVQEGNIGLGRAISRFDVSKGYHLDRYARWWIRQTVTRAIADTGRMIRRPVWVHDAWLGLRRDAGALAVSIGRMPTVDEIAKYSSRGLSRAQIRSILHMGGPDLFVAWDALVDDRGTSSGDVLPERQVDLSGQGGRRYAVETISWLFENNDLSGIEKLVLALQHGALDAIPEDLDVRGQGGRRVDYIRGIESLKTGDFHDGLALQQIANALGYTKEGIRMIAKRALRKAKAAIEAHGQGPVQ